MSIRFVHRVVQVLKLGQTKSDQSVRLAQFNTYDARRFLSVLLERASRGEEIVIARSGQPIAKLGPICGGEVTRPGIVRTRIVVHEAEPI
jgi:antitoxin (DNA-binding transcriptional repressor) of toxin-antitoxin stability system